MKNIVDCFDDFESITKPSDGMLPPGGFHAAPMCTISKRENHGDGYHAHLLVYKQGGYVRGGYALTLDGEDEIVLYEHNAKQHIDVRKHLRKLRKGLERQKVK